MGEDNVDRQASGGLGDGPGFVHLRVHSAYSLLEGALPLKKILGKATAVDIAQVNDKTCFINMATGGFGTRITSETPEKLKAARFLQGPNLCIWAKKHTSGMWIFGMNPAN